MKDENVDENLELFRQEKLAEEAKTKYARTDKAFVETETGCSFYSRQNSAS